MKRRLSQPLFLCIALCSLGLHLSVTALSLNQSVDCEYEELPDINPYFNHATSLTNASFPPAQTFLRYITRNCPPDVTPGEIAFADTLLEQDVYQRTNPPNQRPILDYPAFYFPYCRPDNWSLAGQLWYNQTPKVAFYENEFSLRSYLSFENQNLINEIDDFVSLFGNLNIPKVFSLLGDIEIEERRAAVMGWWAHERGKWLLQIKTPIAYIERNFQLNEQEKAQLESELELFQADNDIPSGASLPLSEKEKQEAFDEFAKKHLISDKVGLGDTRLTAGYTFIDKENFWLNTGFLATLPTAFAFKRGGMYGSYFKKNSDNPPFDLVALLDLVVTDPQKVQDATTDFLIGALDKLSANLLESEIGNGGHFGVGFCLDNSLFVSQKLRFNTHAEFEYLLPAVEKRFYINKKNPNDFIGLNTTPASCEQDLQFIQQQIIETLYPRVYDTLVFPGVVLKFSTAADIWVAPRSHLMLGYDLWWQQQEMLGRLTATTRQRILARTDIARKPAAFQSKFFGALTYEHSGSHGNWCISLTADQTFLSSGIGKDFSASLRVEYLF